MKFTNILFLLLFLSSSFIWAMDDTEIIDSIIISDLPPQVQNTIKEKYPQLTKKNISLYSINQAMKNLSHEYSFDYLRLVEKNGHYYLDVKLNEKIENIVFANLADIETEEALELMNLNVTDLQIEAKRLAAIDKLQSYFKNKGYRKAIVVGNITSNQNGVKEFTITSALGDKTIISDVKIQGLLPEDSKKIEYKFNWYGKNKVLSSENLNEINKYLREFLNNEGYYLVSIPFQQIIYSADEKKAQLVYKLKAQQKYEIEILNNKTFSRDTLENEVLKLNEYTTVDSNFGIDLSEKIKNYYLANGFAQADINYYERKKNDKIVITLNITEGEQTRISKIKFSGNFSRPESYYVNKFIDYSTNDIQDGVFIYSDIELAEKNFLTFLKNEGFLNCKLSRAQIQPTLKDPNHYVISYNLEEGPQTKLMDIKISGNKNFSTQKILETLKLAINQNLNLNKLEVAINDLKVLYANSGFIESKITSEEKNLITYSENLTEAYLNIEIYEGPQVSVGSIIIEGNSKTHSKLILTELDFKPGDILTPAKLEETTARLQRTGHFSSTEIYTLEANSPIAQRTIIVRVTERNPGVFTSGVGLTNENNYTLQGYLGVAYRNIGGWGRGASARYEGSYNPDYIKFLESTLTFGYLEPYLFDTRMRFRINYTSSRKVSDLSVRKVTITNQAIWSIEQDFTSHITGIYEILNISNYVDQGISREDEIKYNYSRDDMVIATTGPTIDIDYRDNILNPTSGHFTKLSLEISPQFLGNNHVDSFYRTTGQTTLYTPLSEIKPFVWANSFRVGYVKNISATENGVPFDKKGFVLGGRSTIRGFEPTEFFPSTKQIGASYKFKDYAQYQLIKSEFRIPITKSNDFDFAVFYDGGEVEVDNIQLADKWRDSIGVGLHYNTPVGPINLEYARKLDKKSYESDGAFHLSVGVF